GHSGGRPAPRPPPAPAGRFPRPPRTPVPPPAKVRSPSAAGDRGSARPPTRAHELLSSTTSPGTPTEDAPMADTTITKVDSRYSPRGPEGQKYLAASPGMGMRLWEDEAPGEAKPERRRDYETVGYVISGR